MAKSAPDYYSSVSIAGKFGDQMIPVLVDATGQMYIALTGQEVDVANLPADYFKKDESIGTIAGSEVNLTVDQENSDRLIQGKEGANTRYIAVDGNGIMLARMKGSFGGLLKDIAVDTTGHMITLIQGDGVGGLQTVKVDATGHLLTDISKQGLDFLTVRPAYGGARRKEGDLPIPTDRETEIAEIEGRGIIYGGSIWIHAGDDRKNTSIVIYADGAYLQSGTYGAMFERGLYPGTLNLLVVNEYDPVNFRYSVFFPIPFTFETGISIRLFHEYGVDQNANWDIHYALIP